MGLVRRPGCSWRVFVAAAAGSLAAQSMERDGYVLPPASVQELLQTRQELHDARSAQSRRRPFPGPEVPGAHRSQADVAAHAAAGDARARAGRQSRMAARHLRQRGAEPLLAQGSPHLSGQASAGRVRQRHALVAGRDAAGVCRASADGVAGVGRRREDRRREGGERCAGDGHAGRAARWRRRNAGNRRRTPAAVDAGRLAPDRHRPARSRAGTAGARGAGRRRSSAARATRKRRRRRSRSCCARRTTSGCSSTTRRRSSRSCRPARRRARSAGR